MIIYVHSIIAMDVFHFMVTKMIDNTNWFTINYEKSLGLSDHPEESGFPTIDVAYKVEGLEFNNFGDAQKHLKKIKLFNILSKDLSPEECDQLTYAILDKILDNAEKIRNILR